MNPPKHLAQGLAHKNSVHVVIVSDSGAFEGWLSGGPNADFSGRVHPASVLNVDYIPGQTLPSRYFLHAGN